jgi:hypothetical protein
MEAPSRQRALSVWKDRLVAVHGLLKSRPRLSQRQKVLSELHLLTREAKSPRQNATQPLCDAQKQQVARPRSVMSALDEIDSARARVGQISRRPPRGEIFRVDDCLPMRNEVLRLRWQDHMIVDVDSTLVS